MKSGDRYCLKDIGVVPINERKFKCENNDENPDQNIFEDISYRS